MTLPFSGLRPNTGNNTKLTAQAVTSSGVPNQTATLNLRNDGSLSTQITGGSETIDSDEWLNPPVSVDASLYECQATVISGSLSSGTAGSWLSLGTTRTWTRSQNVSGTSEVVFTLEVRLIGTANTLASANMTLTADKA